MGRDPEGGGEGEEEGQRVTDTKKARGAREKAISRSCCEGNNGRKRKERRRPTNTEMGGQTGKRTPGQKHKRGAQKRSKKKENPKPKAYPNIPTQGRGQGQPGRSGSQLPPRAHNPHRGAGIANGQSAWAGGTVQDGDPQGRWPQTPRPAPSTSSPGSRTMGRGGWGHPASIQPGYLSSWGREGNTGVCLPEKGEKGKGQPGLAPA